jgi:uncharacterized protein YecT (DUF1311 family)
MLVAQQSNPKSEPCADTSSNLEYSECWQARAKRARTEADTAFARIKEVAERSDLQESSGGDERHWLGTALQLSQDSWTKTIDQQCQFEGKIARGGTGTRTLVAKCQDRLNRQRAEELTSARELIESNS